MHHASHSWIWGLLAGMEIRILTNGVAAYVVDWIMIWYDAISQRGGQRGVGVEPTKRGERGSILVDETGGSCWPFRQPYAYFVFGRHELFLFG
jgi:hypothetical protein